MLLATSPVEVSRFSNKQFTDRRTLPLLPVLDCWTLKGAIGVRHRKTNEDNMKTLNSMVLSTASGAKATNQMSAFVSQISTILFQSEVKKLEGICAATAVLLL